MNYRLGLDESGLSVMESTGQDVLSLGCAEEENGKFICAGPHVSAGRPGQARPINEVVGVAYLHKCIASLSLTSYYIMRGRKS